MKKSITQEFDYGCGVACFAFATNLTYKQSVKALGREQTVKFGWRPSDLTKALNNYSFSYKNNYVRKSSQTQEYPEATIVLIERSATYPVGHYLIRHNQYWMDPWINMPIDNNIYHAESGFRERLPGKAMYALIPQSS